MNHESTSALVEGEVMSRLVGVAAPMVLLSPERRRSSIRGIVKPKLAVQAFPGKGLASDLLAQWLDHVTIHYGPVSMPRLHVRLALGSDLRGRAFEGPVAVIVRAMHLLHDQAGNLPLSGCGRLSLLSRSVSTVTSHWPIRFLARGSGAVIIQLCNPSLVMRCVCFAGN
jgi:hypothetical protein